METEIAQITEKAHAVHIEMLNRLSNVTKLNESPESYSDLENQIKDVKSRLQIKLVNKGKVSGTLIYQMALHLAGKSELYTINHNDIELRCIEYFHTTEILDLIGSIEEENDKVKTKPLNGKYLKGLKHVHHSAFGSKGYSAIKNCINYWYNQSGKLQFKRENDFKELIAESKSNIPARMYDKAIRSKFKKGLTGEWLIYAVHNEVNYFLCLAKHEEGDEAIYKNKIAPALEEFPELKEYLKITMP